MARPRCGIRESAGGSCPESRPAGQKSGGGGTTRETAFSGNLCNDTRQGVCRKLSLFFVNDQWRRQANCRRAGAQKQKPPREALVDDRITELGGGELHTD